MKSQTDPLGNKEIIYYDQLGRVFKREFKDPSDFLKYRITYDFVSPGTTDASSLHLLTFTDASDNVINKIQYTYDNFGRISSKDEYVGNDQFTWTYTYNQYSRVSTETYPSGVAATYLYDDKGFLNQVKRTDGSHNEVIWQLDSLDEFEKTIQSRVGEGNITTKYEFNDYELPTRIHTFKGETFQDLQYSFDPNRGVLTWRRDEKNNQEESFGYDELYRLTRDTINNDLNKIITLSYYKDGSINNKSDVGTYYYSDGQTQNPPHGVKKIPEIEGNTSISHLKQDITHNMFNRVEELRIKNGNDIVEEAIFTYGHDKNRRKMEFRETGELLYTKFYLGNYEKIVRADNSIKEITYISGRSGIVAAIVKGDDELNPTAEQTIFIHTDHLGSIQALSREKEGQPGEYEVITEFAYDPWGRLRNETNWLTYYNDEGAFSHFALLERGFIGQEHLSKFGLINLNARLYDQTLGSFLGCDNFVQNPSNSQSFNRFSYCMNNPLMYRDANGNFAFIPLLIGMAYGAAIGSATAEVTYSITAAITGNWSWKGFGKAIGMGAVGGALGGGLGYLGTTGLGAFGNSFGYSMLSNITGNSVTSAIFGSKITLGSFVGMVAGSAIGGLIGNNFGKYGESSFWNGVKDVAATTAKGLVTGYVRGFTRAAFENNSNAIWQESLGGAIGGFSSGLAINLLYGAPVNVKINFRVLNNEKLSELFKNPYQRPVFRSGGLLSLSGSLGGQVAGRDVYLNSPNANDATVAHELFYLYQQDKYGFAGFYIPTVWDQINYNMFGGSYPYTNPQSYEYEADQFEQQFYYK
jgi:RHS repeat-associated protein